MGYERLKMMDKSWWSGVQSLCLAMLLWFYATMLCLATTEYLCLVFFLLYICALLGFFACFFFCLWDCSVALFSV